MKNNEMPNIKNKSFAKRVAFATAWMAIATSRAFAGTATGMPWESPLTTLKDSLSGPVAMAISIIAIVVCGCLLIFGGEIGDFAKKMILLVLVIAMIVAANSVLSTLFGTTGALLG